MWFILVGFNDAFNTIKGYVSVLMWISIGDFFHHGNFLLRLSNEKKLKDGAEFNVDIVIRVIN